MKKEMENFKRRFAEALSGSVLPMDTVLRYLGDAKGKRLRPQLVFMTAKLFGEINETTRRTALFAELLHTATLVHDDVVDDSDERRGQASVKARWNNMTAVLVGDYLMAKAMTMLSDPSENIILKEMLHTAMMMSEGELEQLEERKSEDGSQKTEAIHRYLNIITRKTAMLFRACCMSGALSVHAPAEAVRLAAEFGLNYGILFQLRDDIQDADDAATMALAQQLLPEYQSRTQAALDALKPLTTASDMITMLSDLTNGKNPWSS